MVRQCPDGRGWGLRPKNDVKAGEFVMEYVGEVIDEVEQDRRIAEYARRKEQHMYVGRRGCGCCCVVRTAA